MKIILNWFVLLLLVCTLAMTGCSAPGDETSEEAPSDSKTYDWGKVTGETITIWGDPADLERPYNTREFERYQELTGNKLEVKPLSKQDYDSKVSLAFSSDGEEKPDILLGYGGVNLESVNPHKNLYDFKDAPWIDDLTDTSIKASVYKGKIIGLPHGEASVSGILYNKSLFKKHGLTVPKTQDEFLQVCEKLLEKGVTPIYLPYAEISMLLYQLPLDTVVADKEILDGLNNWSLAYEDIPEMAQILEWYKVMTDKGYFGENYEKNDWGGMDHALKSEKYAMMICWDTWLYTSYTGDPSEIGLMPQFMGIPEEGSYGGANVLMFMVNKNSPRLEAALDFINYLADPVNYNRAYKGIYTAPVFINQSGSFTTPQYMEIERHIDKLFCPSIAWSQIKGFSQMDASFIQEYMQGGYNTLNDCLKDMEASRRKRAGADL